ncbi:hypothetical protein DPMN_184536 [Dreissena polymorpha]|uniref:Uncharacterized protein n=1 Tax=Dreissena polymorpha TaxID=45954 RepID=A0A9D4DKK3_DREPO|nr:hypothetical protein DPMN_184536 [Dreissena polymorpha]
MDEFMHQSLLQVHSSCRHLLPPVSSDATHSNNKVLRSDCPAKPRQPTPHRGSRFSTRVVGTHQEAVGSWPSFSRVLPQFALPIALLVPEALASSFLLTTIARRDVEWSWRRLVVISGASPRSSINSQSLAEPMMPEFVDLCFLGAGPFSCTKLMNVSLVCIGGFFFGAT